LADAASNTGHLGDQKWNHAHRAARPKGDIKREEDDAVKQRQIVKQCQANREMITAAKRERLLPRAAIE
jgi:hypothetical protein